MPGEALLTGEALCCPLPTFGSSRSWEDIGSHSQGGSINQKGKALEDVETTTLSASCAQMEGPLRDGTQLGTLFVSVLDLHTVSLFRRPISFICVCLSLCVNCMLCVHVCSSAWAHECGSVCPCGVWSMMPRCLPLLFFILSCVETGPLIDPEAHHVG